MNRRLSSKAVFTASIFCLLLMPALLWAAATQAADIDQWTFTGNAWQNGNLSDYSEDDVVGYRAKLTGLTVGHSYTIWIEYDTTTSGKHAIDFLKTYNATEPGVDPCAGVTCSGSPTTFPIPIDPNINNSVNPHPLLSYLPADPDYQFTMWGGTINGAGPVVLTGGTFTGGVYSASSKTAMPITFTASATSTVLAWGGHVSTHSDWGVGTTAVNVNGSPYHMRLGGVNDAFVNNTTGESKNLGNQDRSMQIDYFASRITVIKHGDPGDSSTLFPFTLAQPGGGKCESPFELAADDSQHLCTRIRHSGSYTITETLDGVNNFKWALTDIACTSIGDPAVSVFTKSALPANAPTDGSVTFNINVEQQQDVTCTFTNKHKPMLTLDKVVVNNYGGDAQPGDFNFHTTGTNVMKSSDGSPVTPGTILKDGDSVVMDGGSSYAVTEESFYGYLPVSSANCSGTLDFNNEVLCAYTNSDIQPKLTVIKHVINNNGGSSLASDFSMSVAGTNVSQEVFLGSETGVTVTLHQGAYSVSESGPVTNYLATLNNCVGPIHVGDEKICVITNDDIGPKLNIIKNTNGGDATFPIVLTWPEGNANTAIQTSNGTGSTGYIETSTGAVSVEEILTGQPLPGWDFTSVTCQEDADPAQPIFVAQGPSIALNVLQLGHNYSCTFTNTRRALITVHKVTNPENSLQSFGVTINGTGTISGSNAGLISVATPVTFEVTAGEYLISETALAGWDQTGSTCDPLVVVAPGDVKDCTITNTQRGRLKVSKVAAPSDGTEFSITADGSVNTSAPLILGGATRAIVGGETEDYDVAGGGTYSVTEAALAGWDMTGNTCSNIYVAPGAEETCTITNTKRGHLKVVKVTAPSSDTTTEFSITADGSVSTNAQLILGDATRAIVGGETEDYDVAGGGTYSVTEAALAGWDMTGNTCSNIYVAPGAEETCTITNTKRGHLKVVKVTAPSSDTTTEFSITAGGSVSTDAQLILGDATRAIVGGETEDYDVAGGGTYSVTEAALAGWDMTGNTCSNIYVAPGAEETCTITNTKRGHLKVLKVTDPASDTTTEFSITADGTVNTDAQLILGDATRAIVGGETEDYDVAGGGTYSVAEAALAGWDMTGNTCNNIYVAPGAEETCTITNTQRGHIIVTKHTDPASDTSTEFPVTASGSAPSGAPAITGSAARVLVGNSGTTDYEVAGGGTYSVEETVPANWIQVKAEGCASIVVAPGATMFCDIYNSAYGHVIVTKIVVNDNGGTALSANFTMNFAGNQPTLTSFPGSEQGTTVDVLAGEYSVTESGPNGYLGQFSEGCSGTIAAGETKYCTITNDDIQPQLIVTKTVINDNGGKALSSDFLMNVNGSGVVGILSFPGSVAGTTVGINAGTYSVTESGPGGYEGTMSLFCTGTINIGEIRFCDIVNNDIAPRLIVHKVVVNNDGKSSTATSFSIQLNNGSAVPFQQDPDNNPLHGIRTFDALTVGVPYTVTEVAAPGYQANYSGSCSNVVLALGQTAECTITNHDIPAGLATNSELCQFDYNTAVNGNQFNLNFKKDGPKYILNASNPGQFYYNVVNGSNSPADVTMQIPFPFVTHGATPIHVYTSFQWNEGSRCFTPTGPATYVSSQQIVFNPAYDQFGEIASITIPGVPAGAYVNVHLDYGFKDTAGWGKSGSDAAKAPWTIQNNHSYVFDILAGGASSTISNQNKF